MAIETVLDIQTNRSDVYPSPMPAEWKGSLVVQVLAHENGVPVWGIMNNGSPVTPRKRSTDRTTVEETAVDAAMKWVRTHA